ncbi:unnamed protein product [marine sediment metagenome]|uniref:Uncharacterized protein n=1 Tax=marine sediment metagenome TaxID=412755 RepID=X0UYC1_9ZZZZ
MQKNKKSLNKREYREMLDDICDEYCSEENDCVLKEFLVSAHPSPRLLMQMKCVERFRKNIAKEQNKKHKEIEWSEAMAEWVLRGYAKKFADVYKEGEKYIATYKKVVEDE